MIVYAPKTHNIKVVSGIGVAFEYESVDESGDPVNFPSNTEALLQVIEGARVVVEYVGVVTNNIVTFDINSESTYPVPGAYMHRSFVTYPSGEKEFLAEGSFVVE